MRRNVNGERCDPCDAGYWCDGSLAQLRCYGLPSNCMGEVGCAPGFKGKQCGFCASGFLEIGRSAPEARNATGEVLTCRACPNNSRAIIISVMVSISAVAVSVLILDASRDWGCCRGCFCKCCTRCRSRVHHFGVSHAAFTSVALRHYQALSALYAASALPYPNTFREFLSGPGSLGINQCLEGDWLFINGWTLRCCLPLAVIVTLALDWVNLSRDTDDAENQKSPVVMGHNDGARVFFVEMLRRLTTNAPQRSKFGYGHRLYSNMWLTFSLNIFFPYALKAVHCAGGVSFYDQTLSCTGSIYYYSLFYAIAYGCGWAWYYVLPLCPGCTRGRCDGKDLTSGFVVADFADKLENLAQNLLPFCNSLLVLVPEFTRGASGVLLALLIVEVGVFFMGAPCKHQANHWHGLKSFETPLERNVYLLSLLVLGTTYAVGVDCSSKSLNGQCPAIESTGAFLLTSHVLFFFIFCCTVLGYTLWCGSCKDHGRLRTCQGFPPPWVCPSCGGAQIDGTTKYCPCGQKRPV